jgi:putative PIN family toxin of toxin-antitoxin system
VRVVLDTNVIISRFLTPHGSVARIVELWEGGAFELVVSEAILTEYSRVLRYPRLRELHHLSDAQLDEIDEGFREFAELVEPLLLPSVVEDDPDDNHLLACSETGQVDCLVSGDRHLLQLGAYKDIPILSPAEFLARYFAE